MLTIMRKQPTKENFNRLCLKPFSEVFSPKDELLYMLTLMQLRLNNMKEKTELHHLNTLKSWGFNYKAAIEIGINLK
jgi:hypothetical protein|tara:strand:- start:984 stop:1214 length:231 start_codon:yes stop_codon:yes gene_type:complete